MQNRSQESQIKKGLYYSLFTSGAALLIANFFGQAIASSVSLSIYMPATLMLVVLSIIISKRFGLKGDHGKAWFLFVIFVSLWFIAERTAFHYNLTTGEEPFPSEADAFWLAGYPFLFAFLVFYLKPIKEMISKKILGLACLVAVSSILLCLPFKSDVIIGQEKFLDILIGLSYPVGDAIVLVPAILGVVLFFRGRVNFLWSLMCVAILFELVADIIFFFISLNDSYYQGHPVDILFIWYYIIFTFGVYSHISIFKEYKKDSYNDIGKLR